MILDDPGALAAIDRHDTRRVLTEFPEQCRRALALRGASAIPSTRPRIIIVAGMGGSASGGDLLAACSADTLDVPIVVHRGYGLPAAATREALVLALSYSGDTAEVLSATEAAIARNVPLVAVTAGGALGSLADSRRLPRVTLPSGLMPRMALGYLLFPSLAILAECGAVVATPSEVDEALDVLAGQADDLGPRRPSDKNEAKRLALGLGDRMPAIYGGPLSATAAYRWKTDLEENAKALAVAGAVPEMNHNEIEAWRSAGARQCHIVLLRDAADAPEITARFVLLREMLAGSAGGVDDAWARGQGRLARLLSLVYLGQWTSFYVAVLRGVDPWPVPMLEEVKRRLARRGDGAGRSP